MSRRESLDRTSSIRKRPTACAAVLLLALVLSGTIATPQAPAADSEWLYGVHWYGDPNGSIVESMTGGKGIWSLEIVIPYSDPWWQASGQLWQFQQIVARGHTIICRIQPNWGITASKPPTYELSAYLTKVWESANTLKDVVHIWQIGNEMNLYSEYGGDVLSAADYVDEFKQVRATIQSVTSSLGEQIVLLGPVSPGAVIAGVRHTDGNVYVGQMCDLLDPDDLDGFAIHGYAAPWNDAATSRSEFQAGYASQLAVIDDRGFSSKLVHITEWNRRVEPISDSNEAQSAQFLHGAFADLHAWNQTPGCHPISSACWFIYKDDPGWTNYSIEYLHGVGPSGQDNDLWDAFQYACTQDYPTDAPSGDNTPLMYDGTPPGVNVALTSTEVETDSHHDSSSTGDKAIDGVIAADSKWASAGTTPPHWLRLDLGPVRHLSGLVVRHAGAGGEPSYFNTQAFQLQTAASAAGPWAIDAIVANTSQANTTAKRYYVPRFVRHVRLYITDPGIDNWARIPEFEAYEADLGDFDTDGDVDLHDFARFQACFSGDGVDQKEADCFFAHFDEDDDVDLTDYSGFASAFGGP